MAQESEFPCHAIFTDWAFGRQRQRACEANTQSMFGTDICYVQIYKLKYKYGTHIDIDLIKLYPSLAV